VATETFLADVADTAANRVTLVNAQTVLWRAQVGHDEFEDDEGNYRISGLPPERMLPLLYSASEGRINAKGIPCLYMATDRETAIAEVRPWRHTLVSIAVLETIRDSRLVDCSADRKPRLAKVGAPPPRLTPEEAVWSQINEEFAAPVERSDSNPDYVPTQILADVFRHHGYDGVIYASSVASGKNVALFDARGARLLACELHRVDDILYTSSEYANAYYLDQRGDDAPPAAPA
jgi:RES domain-containing protein